MTEMLDPVFSGIKSTSPETQWIYLSTAAGMMRLYPWASNDHYPESWDPREAIFYTVAEPTANPSFAGRWTPPYVDFAGAGWMVTYSTPVLDKQSNFRGIMSHDITIGSLKQAALDTRVHNNVGYGFLIDSSGNMIAHPTYGAKAQAEKGTTDNLNLLTVGTPQFRDGINKMLSKQPGIAHFVDEQGQMQLLAYAPVEAINWNLGVVVPWAEVVKPATDMRNRALAIALLVVMVVVGVALLLTRGIVQPLRQLLAAVDQVRTKGQANMLTTATFTEFNELSEAFNNMAGAVRQRQKNLQSQVQELKIQIDSQLSRVQIDSIVETDYFKHLEVNAERLRQHVKTMNETAVVVATTPTP